MEHIPRNVLITGGAGFIGSQFARHLLKTDSSLCVVVFDKLTYAGNPHSIKDLELFGNRYSFVRGDINDLMMVRDVLKQHKIDTVANFAAETHVDRSIHGSLVFTDSNDRGTHVLLMASREAGVARYIQVSTDEVYGSLESHNATEEFPVHPGSPYAAAKAAGDLMVLAFYNTYKMPVVVTRCSNNYGPYQYPEKLIPRNLLRVLKGQTFQIYGHGRQIRNWIHVSDHLKGVDAAMRRARLGEIYNFGTDVEYSNRQIASMICKLAGKADSSIEEIPDPRPGHDFRYGIDSSKAQKELGWKPQISFPQGLSDTVNWYKSNQHWLESIESWKKELGV
ncbi:dTDP-glucose 4,6-dehydratase [Candidatus Woesearchaeota archaeon]|nr:dTDP-glucose 4,6-dehydratase [Candidatus Woesearchaeota archaeon]